MAKLILASGSKWRKQLLEMSGFVCEAIPSDCDENIEYTNPEEYVLELSKEKAEDVAKRCKEGIVLAADTIGHMNNKRFEKPKDREEAFNFMSELSGKGNDFITGVTIIDLYQNKTVSFTDNVKVKLQELSDDEINWYIDNQPNIYDCAGYVADECAALFITELIGDYKSMVGLPINKIYNELKKLGYSMRDFRD
ncbi:MAG: septum formation protein Maf [Clostridia bacterium]|nr:septum formation protein Maf [Clostridia bacterium]